MGVVMDNLPAKMRGVWLTGHGDMDKLDIREDIPVPSPGPQDVLVRVAAAGVNNTDINTRIAWYSKKDAASEDASWSGQALRFPRIQGADVCGRIFAVATSAVFLVQVHPFMFRCGKNGIQRKRSSSIFLGTGHRMTALTGLHREVSICQYGL